MDCGRRLEGALRVLTGAGRPTFLPENLAARLSRSTRPIDSLAPTEERAQGTCGPPVSQPAAARCPRSGRWATGIRKVTEFTEAQGAASVLFPEGAPPPFLNVNRPEDLARAESLLAKT